MPWPSWSSACHRSVLNMETHRSVTLLLLYGFAFIQLYYCENRTDVDPLQFLIKFGYIDSRLGFDVPATTNDSSEDPAQNVDISPAVRKFQNFLGLEETGKLDEETMQWMKRPRCGVKDFSNEVANDDPGAQPFKVKLCWV